jgi:hypothetical protein
MGEERIKTVYLFPSQALSCAGYVGIISALFQSTPLISDKSIKIS